ncbi:MAG: helix-hairpin-helix domain-containing protein, partial [Myxococcaceae bacterium]
IPAYTLQRDESSFDVNGLRAADKARLTTLVGSTVAKAILADRSKFGRFASIDELKARVPSAASLPAEKLAALGNADFGSMQVSINDATVDELDAAGFTAKSAQAIVDFRNKNGDFDSIDQLAQIPGITSYQLGLAKKYITATDVEAFFNSRPFSAAQGGTGYGADSSVRTTTAMGADGKIATQAASVTVAATDLFNRAKAGNTISVAMYGTSNSAPEMKALVDAAKRGAAVRVVLNDDFTEPTVAMLKTLKAQGLDVDVRVQSARTMHEKFGVMGDDVFAGSANFSESSSTKHSENRISVKNQPEIAAGFQAQFDLLWSRSKVV